MSKKSKGSSVVCPVCSAELLPTLSIKVNDTAITLYEDMGEVYQCTAPECNLYFLKMNGKLEQVTKLEILRMQREITELLETERKAVRAEVFPMAMASAEKSELGRALSRLLWTFTTENVLHRAYTIEELYKACTSLGVNPSDVDNDMIPIVMTWLKENLD
jgi:hypothetical protein